MRFQQQLSYHKQLTPVTLIKMMLDPAIIVGMLFGLAFYFEGEINRNHVILALLVFALSFPGTWPKDNGLLAEFKHIISGWPFIVGLLLVFGYATGYLWIYSRELVLNWMLLTPGVMLIAHFGIRKLLYKYRRAKYVIRRAVIIGASELGCQLRDRINAEVMLGIDLKGFFDDRNDDRVALPDGERDLLIGRVSDLAEYVKANSIDLIYIALPMGMHPRIIKLLDDLKDTTASIYFVPDIFLYDLIQARIDDVGGLPVVAVCDTPFSGMNGFIKRTSDIVLSILILTMISPVLLALAIGVKLSSPGPILFKQRRYGLDGQEIVVYKFRSMTVCEDGANIIQAARNDARITKLGAIIRKTSLDELPQFINVLQGRMSIVGPRPHAVAHNEIYRKLIKGYMIRHKVKPGITGWAQINGLRGETETVDKMKARIEYDLDYLRNWTLRLDLGIILRTVTLVFKDAKAY
jgi:putative colanic acid biosynthesis UDP-glucose lipid carrier transferase